MQLSYPQSGTLSMSVCRKNKNNDVSAGPHITQLLTYSEQAFRRITVGTSCLTDSRLSLKLLLLELHALTLVARSYAL